MGDVVNVHNNFMYKKDVKVNWKPHSYYRLTAALRKNKNTDVPMTPRQTRLPSSIKLYRKEIALPNVECSFQRHAVKFDDINAPNGIIKTEMKDLPGTALTQDPKELLHSRQDPKQCGSLSTCLAIESNARKRVRSSGIVKPNYCANTSQYLKYRQMTYDQNTYHFKHNNYIQPQGSTQNSLQNPYTAVSTYKPSNMTFEQNGAVESSTLIARKVYDAKTKTPDDHILTMEFPRKGIKPCR